MDYNAPSGSSDSNASFVGKTASTVGSKVPPRAAEHPQREIVNAEKVAGLTPSGDDTTQLAQSIGRGVWIGTLGASPNALVGAIGGGVMPSAPGVLKSLSPWTRLRGIALQTNTQPAVTVTISGIGVAGNVMQGQLYKRSGAALVAGDIPVGIPFEIQPDGTGAFRMAGAVVSDSGAGTGSAASPTRVLYMLASQTLTVQAGETRARVIGFAGGGGGGGSYGNPSGGSGGGGGGGFDAFVTGLAAGQAIACTVGAGGAAGAAASSGQAGAGGTTSFGSYASATGGTGGFASASIGNSNIGTGGSGTLASGVTGQTYTGSQGGSSYPIGNNAPMSGYGGGSQTGGMPSAWGSLAVSGPGVNGNFPGGAGSASVNQAAGGAGAQGLLIVALYP